MSSRILVVDDEPAIVTTLSTILEKDGYTVASVSTGSEAIAKAQDYRPDLLLSDVRMPGLNGYETGLYVKEVCPSCRLLFFSAHCLGVEDPVSRDDLINRGYRFEVLEKPISPPVLLLQVKLALLKEP